MSQPDPFIDGYRLIDGTELNNRLANPNWSVAPNFIAKAGGTVNNSPLITETVTEVTTASAPNAGVTLPSALPGRVFLVINTSPNDITIYAAEGSTIDDGNGGIPGNIGFTQAAGLGSYFIAVQVKQWFKLDFYPIGFNFNYVGTQQSIATLRTWNTNAANSPLLMSLVENTVAGDGGGLFYLDPTDHVSPDNGTTIIVDAAGNRWKRELVEAQYLANTPYGIVTATTVQGAIDQLADAAAFVIPNITALRAQPVVSSQVVFLEGYNSVGDGGSGYFYGVTGGSYTDNQGTIITPNSGVDTTAWYRMVEGPLYVDYFGAQGNGIADDTAAINAALNSITDSVGGVQLASNKQYRITSSVIVKRGRGIHGDGTPEIIADFSSANWGGDYVAVKFLCDRAYSTAEINAAWAQKTYGFCITGTNNSTLISTGAKFYTSVSITVAQAVNFSWIWGTFENMKVRQFDTALELDEVWSSVFLNVQINYCRQGVFINGKVVNTTFTDINVENPSLSYTSSTADRIGINVQSNNRYGGVEGRPEGMTFSQGLIYGHNYNVLLRNALLINITNMVLDAGVTNSLYIVGPHDYVISGCYIANITANTACIYMQGLSVGTSAAGVIRDNFLWAATGAANTTGIEFQNVGAPRQGLVIQGNSGYLLTKLINAQLCPIYSVISDNYAELHLGTSLIQVVNRGDYTRIENNKCGTFSGVTYVLPVVCHPTVTSVNLDIGNNASSTNKTYAAASVRLLAGATTIQLPNNFYDGTTGDAYIRPVTLANPRTDPGSRWWVVENNTNSSSQFNLTTPLATDLIISYTTKAIPYSAIIV